MYLMLGIRADFLGKIMALWFFVRFSKAILEKCTARFMKCVGFATNAWGNGLLETGCELRGNPDYPVGPVAFKDPGWSE